MSKLNDLPFGKDDDGWDVGDTGQVGISLFGNAIQVWSAFQQRNDDVTIAEAAVAFRCTPQMVRAAVDAHPWMFVAGPDDDFSKQTIEHDGE